MSTDWNSEEGRKLLLNFWKSMKSIECETHMELEVLITMLQDFNVTPDQFAEAFWHGCCEWDV